MKKFNHAYTIAFTVETTTEDPYKVTVIEFMAGLCRRISALLLQWEPEAIDHFDTYEIDEEDPK